MATTLHPNLEGSTPIFWGTHPDFFPIKMTAKDELKVLFFNVSGHCAAEKSVGSGMQPPSVGGMVITLRKISTDKVDCLQVALLRSCTYSNKMTSIVNP